MLHPGPHQYGPVEPIIELRGLTCGYDAKPALVRVDLTLMPGDFVALLGPSGSGKTTLLRSILGTVDFYAGDVLVEGQSVRKKRPRVGYVPQLETIDWNFPATVEQVVLMGRSIDSPIFPWYRKRDREAAGHVLNRLGIAELRKRHIRQLSGGQQQRVFLARALVGHPRILLLDEPTSGTDIKTRDEILHLLDELNHQDMTIVMTTHEINAVAAHLPRVVCLNRRIIADGTPSEVFTTDTLRATYNADIPVTKYQGMTLVAESPHFYGRNGRNGHTRREDDSSEGKQVKQKDAGTPSV